MNVTETAGQRRPARLGAGAIAWMAYAALAYVLFLGSMLYLVAFLLDFGVPRTIDAGGSQGPFSPVVDLGLVALLALQHSVMARPAFKRWLAGVMPAFAERSTFILAADIVVIALVALWQPIPQDIWHAHNPLVAGLLAAAMLVGVAIAFAATFMIDHLDFAGLRQVWDHAHGTPPHELPFTQRWLYRYIRHPIMLGFLVAFWVTPRMTVGHLLFAVAATAEIALGIHLEERNLRQALGEQYAEYQRRVPAVLPARLR